MQILILTAGIAVEGIKLNVRPPTTLIIPKAIFLTACILATETKPNVSSSYNFIGILSSPGRGGYYSYSDFYVYYSCV